MGWEAFVVPRFDLGPLFQVLTRVAKLLSACKSLIVVPRHLGCVANVKESMLIFCGQI